MFIRTYLACPRHVLAEEMQSVCCSRFASERKLCWQLQSRHLWTFRGFVISGGAWSFHLHSTHSSHSSPTLLTCMPPPPRSHVSAFSASSLLFLLTSHTGLSGSRINATRDKTGNAVLTADTAFQSKSDPKTYTSRMPNEWPRIAVMRGSDISSSTTWTYVHWWFGVSARGPLMPFYFYRPDTLVIWTLVVTRCTVKWNCPYCTHRMFTCSYDSSTCYFLIQHELASPTQAQCIFCAVHRM